MSLNNLSFSEAVDRIHSRAKLKKNSTQIHESYIERLASKVINGLPVGYSLSDFDSLSVSESSALIAEEPGYSKLAADLLLSVIFDEVERIGATDFLSSLELSHSVGLVRLDLVEFARRNKSALDKIIAGGTEEKECHIPFEYFGAKTVHDRYLLKHPKLRSSLETPARFFLRVATALSMEPGLTDEQVLHETESLFTLFSTLSYLPSSPTLFNSGTTHEQLSSCFLLDSPDDSLEGIYSKYTDIALLSKYSGGIGIAFHNIRSRGSLIAGTNGLSNGIIPWLKTLDSSVAAVSQGSKRKGACCVYLENWHADIEEFLEIRDNTGDEARRTHNLNFANWVSDLFFKRLEKDEDWSLFDPKTVPQLTELYGDEFESAYVEAENSGLAVKKMKARDLYAKMMKTLAQTGNGWITFKDSSNRGCNQTAKKGNVVHLSNLCVAPETTILTDKGHIRIDSLVDQSVNVWNGKQWSEVVVRKTGSDQKLVTVTLSNGAKIECTEYHKFILSDGTRVSAKELTPGTKLIKSSFPVLKDGEDFKYAYTHGAFCGDGTTYGPDDNTKKFKKISLYPGKHDIKDFLEHRTKSASEDSSGRITLILPKDLQDKFVVPVNASISSKLDWFAGFCDTDGTVHRNGDCESISVSNTNFEFLNNIRLMLLSLGVDSKISPLAQEKMTRLPDHKGGYGMYKTKATYRLLVTAVDTYKLMTLGFSPKRIKLAGSKPGFDRRRFVRVVSVVDHGRIDDTYCFNEPLENAGVFNGVLTGQCTEILEVTNSEETAVCNLGSINLAHHIDHSTGEFDFASLSKTVRTAVRQLNRVIDRTFYSIPTAKSSNSKWRPVGLGLMGLQDVFFIKGIPFDSVEARALSKKISEEIYYHALLASSEIAEENGPHPAFADTRTARGELQFDAWGVVPSDTARWDALRERIKKVGLRNSLIVAIAPTATIASIAGCYECIEPQVSNLFKRETMSGEFIQINKYLVETLKSRGLWTPEVRDEIKSHEGSVQSIDSLPDDLKLVYRTVWETPMRSLIDMAADRGAFICQSQSLNLFMENPTIGALSSMYNYANKKKLKTTYYLRSRPATKINKATVAAPKKTYTDQEAVACSLENPSVCDACQ